MIAKLTKTVSSVFMSAMMLTSCSLVGEKYDMDSAEGIAKVKELIKSCVDTEKNKIYDIEWTEDVRERVRYVPIEPRFLTSREQLTKTLHDYVRKNKRK